MSDDDARDGPVRRFIRGRYDNIVGVRIKPIDSVGSGGLRIELFGCEHGKNDLPIVRVYNETYRNNNKERKDECQ